MVSQVGGVGCGVWGVGELKCRGSVSVQLRARARVQTKGFEVLRSRCLGV